MPAMWGKDGGKGGKGGKDGWGGGWGGGWPMDPWSMMKGWGMDPWSKGMAMKGAMKGKGNGKGGKGEPTRKVFVGGLKNEVGEETIRPWAEAFGEVEGVKMLMDDQGRSKGYCFVEFKHLADAKKLYDNYDKNEIDGNWIDCKPSTGTKAKPGDWYCGMCGDLVFASKPACNSCGFAGGMPAAPGGPSKGAGKAGPPQARPGDWMCPNCGDLVFASKSACTMCGQVKTADAEAPAGGKGFAPY